MRIPIRVELVAPAVTIAAVLLCTGALLARPGDDVPLPRALPHVGATLAREYDAHVVFQLGDCESNLKVLTLFERPPVRARIRVAQLLLIGTAADLAAARRTLGAVRDGAPLRLADGRARRALRAIGYRSTPFLVITDRRGGVKMTLQAPSTSEELVALGQLLPRLASAADGRSAQP